MTTRIFERAAVVRLVEIGIAVGISHAHMLQHGGSPYELTCELIDDAVKNLAATALPNQVRLQGMADAVVTTIAKEEE